MHSTAMEKFYIPTKVCFAAVSARNRFYNTCFGFSTKKIAFLSIAAVWARNRIFCELIRLSLYLPALNFYCEKEHAGRIKKDQY